MDGYHDQLYTEERLDELNRFADTILSSEQVAEAILRRRANVPSEPTQVVTIHLKPNPH